MALVLKDRVKETSTTAGTGTITLAGAVAGFQSFSAVGNGNTTYYAIVDPTSGDWEVGIGTYTSSGTTLSRTTVLSSSNSGALVNFVANVKDVFVTYPAEEGVWTDASGVVNATSFGAITATSAALTTGTVSTTPASNTDIANKLYVDTIATAGIDYHTPVKYEVPDTTGNLTATYNNGASGVGATLTNAGTLGAFTPDGIVASAGDRVLVYNQTSAFQNGVYTVTTVGNGSTAWVLTRATDADSYGVNDPQALDQGSTFFVTSGLTGAGETYTCNTPGVITFGTTAITFAQISDTTLYTAGTGLTLTGTEFSITPTGTAGTYGSASQVPVLTTNASGQVTSVTNTSIAINGSQVSGNISGSAGSVANSLTLGTYLTGGSFNGSSAVTATVDATSANTASKVVARDASGNFSAGTITATLNGSATSTTTATNLAGGAANQIPYQTASGTTAFMTAASGTNYVLNFNGSAFTWVSGTISGVPLGSNLNSLTAGTYLTGTAYNGSAAQTFAVDATSANTASKVVARDASGNFSAGTITASLSGNASTASQLNNSLTLATSGTGLSGSATFNGSSAQTFTVTSNATSANTASAIVARDASGNFSAGTITAALSGSVSASATTSAVNWGAGSSVMNSGNPRSLGIGYSGGEYGGAAYGVTFTSTSGVDQYAINDVVSKWTAYDGLIVYAAAGGAVGTNITWTTVLDARRSNTSMSFKGNTVLASNNYNSYAPTLTGTGASGTWNISITGSSGSADYATLTNKTGGTGTYTTSGDYRAPIFYDSNDTSYYVDPNSTSVLSNLIVNYAVTSGSTATPAVNIRKGWSGMTTVIYDTVAIQSNDVTTIRVGEQDGTTGGYCQGDGYNTFTSTSPMRFYTGGSATAYIYNGMSGTLGLYVDSGSTRAPIFYDYNDTSYYVDPASVSVLSNLIVANAAVSNYTNGLRNVMPGGGTYVTGSGTVSGAIVITLPTNSYPMIRFTVKVYTYDGLSFDINCGGHTSGGTWYNTFAYMTTQNRSALNVRFTYDGTYMYVYIGDLGSSWSYPQVFITDVQVGYAAYTYSNWDDGWSISFNASTYNSISATHTVYPPTSSTNNTNGAYASIYYDANNTGYYVDPASTTYLYSLQLSGNTYFRPNSWIELDGSYGLYWPSNYGAHLHANDLSTYTQLALRGSKNSYGGFYDQYSGVNGFMYDSSGNGGVYREANGRWYLYHNVSNNCTGFGSSTTASGYNIYCGTGIYSGGRVDGTIFYDANNTSYYLDPASSSTLNTIYQAGVYTRNAAGAGYLSGNYSSSESAYTTGCIYTIGGSYYPTSTSFNNMYGIGYSYASGLSVGISGSSGWGMYAAGNGSPTVWLGTDVGTVISKDEHRGTIFYDYANTGYYCDPNSTSSLNIIYTNVLYSYGNVTAYYSSDIKFKENVRDIPNALETVESIGGKLFDWNDEYMQEHGGEDPYFLHKEDFGVIAQDVQKVFPVAVRTRPDGSLAVDYEKLSALAFAAVAELSTRVKSLEARI